MKDKDSRVESGRAVLHLKEWRAGEPQYSCNREENSWNLVIDTCWGGDSDDKGQRWKIYNNVISKLYVEIEEHRFRVSKHRVAEADQKPCQGLIFFYHKDNSKNS